MRRFRRIALLFAALCPPILFAGAPQLKIGDEPPDFLGMDIAGNEVKLSDYRGKVVVVSFWAGWCEPCRKELPVLERLQRVAGPRGVQVLAVNWGEERTVFRKLVKALSEMQMRLISDSSGRVGRSYGVKAIPHMLLIGRDGKIAFLNVGYGESVVEKVVDAVNAALATSPGPANSVEAAESST